MRPEQESTARKGEPSYVIRVAGHLDPALWSAWFDGWHIQPLPSGDTALLGEAVDQAALHGLLFKVRDLNLTLLAVERLGV
jgi:hypothetical protein